MMADVSTEKSDEIWDDIVAAEVEINVLAGTICNMLVDVAPNPQIAALIAMLSARMLLEYAEDFGGIDKPAPDVLAQIYEGVRDAVRNDGDTAHVLQ